MHTDTLSAYYWKSRQIYSNNMNMKLHCCYIAFSAYLFAVLLTSARARNTYCSIAYTVYSNRYSVHFRCFQICFIIFSLSFLSDFFCVCMSARLQSIRSRRTTKWYKFLLYSLILHNKTHGCACGDRLVSGLKCGTRKIYNNMQRSCTPYYLFLWLFCGLLGDVLLNEEII
jgi:hypothetical protein